MARALPEWIGRTPDSKIPDRVKDRIWAREDGICYLSGRKITPSDQVDWDHKIAIVNWTGEGHGNRESNIFPVIRAKHREKTRQDVAEKAASARVRQKHLGIRPAPTMRSAGFAKRPPQHSATRPIIRRSDING
jgi:5-methylcytosine-specific restriction protein A